MIDFHGFFAFALRFGAEDCDLLANLPDKDDPVLSVREDCCEVEDVWCGEGSHKDSPFYVKFHDVYRQALGEIGTSVSPSSLPNPLCVPGHVEYLLKFLLPFYPVLSRNLQCILLPDNENPLTTSCVERAQRSDKNESLEKKRNQPLATVMTTLTHATEDRLLELEYDTNFKKYAEREAPEQDVEHEAHEQDVERPKTFKGTWKSKPKRPPGGHFSKKALAEYAKGATKEDLKSCSQAGKAPPGPQQEKEEGKNYSSLLCLWDESEVTLFKLKERLSMGFRVYTCNSPFIFYGIPP